MTDETTQALLPVTQADRDAAASINPQYFNTSTARAANMAETAAIKNGSLDHHENVQAFASHRISHSGEGRSNGAGEEIERAKEIFEHIGIIASGCATTHGDPGGGLEMVTGYAEDGFRILATLTAPPTSDAGWQHVREKPRVGGTYVIGGYVSRGGMPRGFERTFASCILTIDGPEWSHIDHAKAYIPIEYYFDTGPHPEHPDALSPPTSGEEMRLRERLVALATAEAEYRKLHDLHGDDDMRTGRAWDWMRRKGDEARAALTKGAE